MNKWKEIAKYAVSRGLGFVAGVETVRKMDEKQDNEMVSIGVGAAVAELVGLTTEFVLEVIDVSVLSIRESLSKDSVNDEDKEENVENNVVPDVDGNEENH